MRVDTKKFKEKTCTKCKKFTGDKLIFGKCAAEFSNIYNCARMRMFNKQEFIDWTGIEI